MVEFPKSLPSDASRDNTESYFIFVDVTDPENHIARFIDNEGNLRDFSELVFGTGGNIDIPNPLVVWDKENMEDPEFGNVTIGLDEGNSLLITGTLTGSVTELPEEVLLIESDNDGTGLTSLMLRSLKFDDGYGNIRDRRLYAGMDSNGLVFGIGTIQTTETVEEVVTNLEFIAVDNLIRMEIDSGALELEIDELNGFTIQNKNGAFDFAIFNVNGTTLKSDKTEGRYIIIDDLAEFPNNTTALSDLPVGALYKYIDGDRAYVMITVPAI